LLVAVHVHELSVETEIDAVPPDAGNDVVVTADSDGYVSVLVGSPDGTTFAIALPRAS